MLSLWCWVDFHLGRHVVIAESKKTHRALDAAPLSKVAACWAQCLVPDLTSFHVQNIQKRCLFILFHLCHSWAGCFGCFPFTWFHVRRFTFHIPFRCFVTSLLFQHYTESQLLKQRLWHTHPCRHTCKHTHTHSACMQTHTHTHLY